MGNRLVLYMHACSIKKTYASFLMRELLDLLDVLAGEQEVDLFVEYLHVVGDEHRSANDNDKLMISNYLTTQKKHANAKDPLECGVGEAVVLRRQTSVRADHLDSVAGLGNTIIINISNNQ